MGGPGLISLEAKAGSLRGLGEPREGARRMEQAAGRGLQSQGGPRSRPERGWTEGPGPRPACQKEGGVANACVL